ncbi:hypothetical protein LK996_12360 [Lysobacter sp. A6]|uniref:Type 4 fimbrial biogenesis protein PilX N-terminal domain-containing protein n=1 Tax=Noviluteimonas lactosilytica TaxID=2888523 RepID=A0ABS8JK14_9GAMM|nr:hypothetical protein [Lysobacter lactosilyticus]MCC8363864.1 hypothetical protein [Lysobacter lactosilyticus]
MTNHSALRHPPRQVRGNALLVAVILLLLASVITLLTLNVGLFEQRTSGNDARAKLISEVAEAGIAQGAEYFRLQPNLLKPGGHWELCSDIGEEFPCGSVDASRRDTMYYWVNTTAVGDVNNDGDEDKLDERMLPLTDVVPAAGMVDAVGNFDNVSYGVGVVLCRVKIPEAAGDPTECATNAAEQSSTFVYNYVAVASLPDEGGTRTTVSQMLGQYLLFRPNLNQPPIMASGSVDITGGLQVVTNPNGGGNGVPVSVWTRRDISKTGTPNTCYIDEFFRFGAKNNAPPTLKENVAVCDTCGCNGDVSLSYDKSGNKQDEGIDILDVDGSNGTNGLGVNVDVKPNEFPCDLFEYVFGVKARIDTNGDNFCETLAPSVTYTSPTTNAVVWLDADEAFLYENANKIMPRDATATSLMKPGQALVLPYTQDADTATPTNVNSGIVWCQTGCNIGPGEQIGSPSMPVLLVIDGPARIQGTVFGLILMRTPAATPAAHPLAAAHNHTGIDLLDPATGGTATLDMNAGAVVYGAVVVQGKIDKANGTAAIVFNGDIFKNFSNSIKPTNSNLPGAWTDRLSY